MILKLSLGWNRILPRHDLIVSQNSFVECSILQNYVCRDNKIKKIGGTNRYNQATLSKPITWSKRSYHKLGDGSFVKRTFCFSNGTIYHGNDTTGIMASAQAGFYASAIPLDMTIQVSENSILYLFTGHDTPYKYNGNGSYVWEKSGLSAEIIAGIVHLDRAFYIKENSSEIDYSETLLPETIEDTLITGNDKNSVNRAIVLGADESIFIFKNNSIYQLYGRTPSSFQLRLVTDKYGLASKRAIHQVGSGFIFLNELDNELYFFGGSESSIMNLTEKNVRLREILNLTDDAITNTCMSVHDGLFRFAFQHRESVIDANNCELIYCISEPRPDGLPKWSLIKGSNVNCYTLLNQQGDGNKLITGRSDIGCLMYHNRGFDFDGNAIETIMRTAEVVVSEDEEMIFPEFFVKAKPGSVNVNSTFRYFLNGRVSDRGETSQSMDGETNTVGTIKLQKGDLFNDRIISLCNYRRGNSISFEWYDYANGTDLELYSIAFKGIPRGKIRNQLVGK